MLRPLLLTALATGLAGQLPVPTMAPDGMLVHYAAIGRGVTFAQPSFGRIPNAVAHQHDMIVEHAGWQYVAYWNQDRHIALARRPLRTNRWQTLVLRDYVLTDQNTHDSVNLGICQANGTLHLAFDHHADTLHYRVSVRGLATNPQRFPWQRSLFGAVRSTLDPARGRVTRLTYPRFLTPPAGGLQMAYREFGSGNGRTRIVDYDPSSGAWSNDRIVIERTGAHTDPLGGASSSRNPYFNSIAYDDQGVLHATWTWRERATRAYNRDIAYAYSPDHGRTWHNGAHRQLADTSRGQAITAASPGVNAVTIGAEWGLMNNQAHVVDGRGRVHVVMYHKDRADTRVSFASPSNSHYHHFWKDADGVWRRSQLPTIGNRPKLFAGRDGTLYLAYVRYGALRVDRATAAANYLDWTTVRSLPGRVGTSAQGAAHTFGRGTHLSIGVQGVTGNWGTSTELGIAETWLPWPASRPRTYLSPTADAYVRAGAHASTNYGSTNRLIVKDDANTNFDREALLKFDVRSLRGRPVKRVLLAVSMRTVGTEGRTTPYFAHAIANDTWTELSVTWNNRPAAGSATAAHFGRREMQWDVTTLAMREAGGDGTLSLGLRSRRVGANRTLLLWSREATNPGLRPRLIVEQ